MTDTPTLGAVIITENEATNIAECLAMLHFCSEIIVLDSGSTDDTTALAVKAGATVVTRTDWQGYGVQKQRALELATTDWVLSIDADERVPEALAAEILDAVAHPKHAGYRLNRRTMFLGRFLKHGGWYPDQVVRLARRDACQFSGSIVHEEMQITGSVGALDEPMLHYSYRTIDDVLTKLRAYALASAKVRRARGRRGGLFSALLRANLAFVKAYVLQAGFL
ncbi:unnamed protein product, partial [Laminaria digitata]